MRWPTVVLAAQAVHQCSGGAKEIDEDQVQALHLARVSASEKLHRCDSESGRGVFQGGTLSSC
jgi:hypothetical protein